MDYDIKQKYNEVCEELKLLINDALNNGEITDEETEKIAQLKQQEQLLYKQLNNSTNVDELKIDKKYIVDILTDYGKSTLLKIEEDGHITVGDSSIPALTLLSQKISLIASYGEDESSVTITPEMIEAIASSDIKLSAKKILINGLLGGTGWQVDEEGNLDINDLNIHGDVSCDSANFSNIICPTIPNCLSENKKYYTTDIQEILNTIPQDLGGHTVDIYMSDNISDNIELPNLNNGIVDIFMQGYTLYGYIKANYTSCQYNIYGGQDTSTTANRGAIMPNNGYAVGSYNYSVFFSNNPNVNIKSITIVGDTNTSKNVGFGATNKSNCQLEDIVFSNCKYNCRVYSMAEVYCISSSGKSTGHSWFAGTGSKITLNPTTQAGGTDNTHTSGNAQIISDGVTFDGASSTISNTNTSNTSTVATKVLTCKPTLIDTYRHTVYNSWKKDGVARQGDWGYGDCEGYFFYGNQFSAVKGKDIIKVVVTIHRNSNAGNSTSCSHGIIAHTYSTRTSSEPSSTSTGASISLGWGNTDTATITNSTILNSISNGTIKGLGIRSSYDSSHYSSCSNGTVKIYYKE